MLNKFNFFFTVLVLLLVSCADKSTKINLPSHVYLEKKSPNKITMAIIYSWRNDASNNLLGSDYRFMLGFSNSNSKWYVDFELSEGYGTYEGGVTGLEWQNNNEVLIKRIISDRNKDIKYNIALNKWTLVK